MDPFVRLAKTEDIPRIIELSRECIADSISPFRNDKPEEAQDHWKKILQTFLTTESLPLADTRRILVLEDRSTGEFIGYLTFMVDQINWISAEKETFFLDMGIIPKYRGKGLWKLLFAEGEALARHKGNLFIAGAITATNRRSLQLHLNSGYRIEKYGMVKRLSQDSETKPQTS